MLWGGSHIDRHVWRWVISDLRKFHSHKRERKLYCYSWVRTKDFPFYVNVIFAKSLLYLRSRGFFSTSYQANFASHHTRNRQVGFLLAWHGIGKCSKMFRYFLFNTTIPNYRPNSVTRILAHTLSGNFESFCEVNQKFKRLLLLLLLISIPRHTKRKPGGGPKLCPYRRTASCKPSIGAIIRRDLRTLSLPCDSLRDNPCACVINSTLERQLKLNEIAWRGYLRKNTAVQ